MKDLQKDLPEIAKEEGIYKKPRKERYLLHLLEVNSPFYNEGDCINLVASRAKCSVDTAIRVLKEHGFIGKSEE